MKYCPECFKVFALDDPFREDVCDVCENELEDVDEYMETPRVYCAACYAVLGGDVPTNDEGDFVCPECGATNEMYMEAEE